MTRMVLFSFFCLLASCSTERSTSREVKKETEEKRKATVILAARQGDYYFNLRDNAFFDYFGINNATGKTDLYAGTYSRKGDSLLLGFHNKYQPEDLTGTAFIDRANNVLILVSKDPVQNRHMSIVLNNSR